VLAVDAQAKMQLHGLVKFREFDLLDQGNSFLYGIGLEFDLLEGSGVLFACFAAHNLIGPNG